MLSKEDWEIRQRQWALFHEWEAAREPDPYAWGEVIADVGAILDWLPEDVRQSDLDPGKSGIQRMRHIVSVVSQKK